MNSYSYTVQGSHLELNSELKFFVLYYREFFAPHNVVLFQARSQESICQLLSFLNVPFVFHYTGTMRKEMEALQRTTLEGASQSKASAVSPEKGDVWSKLIGRWSISGCKVPTFVSYRNIMLLQDTKYRNCVGQVIGILQYNAVLIRSYVNHIQNLIVCRSDRNLPVGLIR